VQLPASVILISAVEIPSRFGSFSFESDFWKGPKPTPETIYPVHLVADEREFQGPASALERWTSPIPGTIKRRDRMKSSRRVNDAVRNLGKVMPYSSYPTPNEPSAGEYGECKDPCDLGFERHILHQEADQDDRES
jgi:hypothetical protein